MANRDRKEPDYLIEKTSYMYKKTGIDENGRPVFEQVGNPKSSVCKGIKNFKELKKSLHEASKKDSNFKVNYEDPKFTAHKFMGKTTRITKDPARVKNTVKHVSDDEYVVTYFNAKSKK